MGSFGKSVQTCKVLEGKERKDRKSGIIQSKTELLSPKSSLKYLNIVAFPNLGHFVLKSLQSNYNKIQKSYLKMHKVAAIF